MSEAKSLVSSIKEELYEQLLGSIRGFDKRNGPRLFIGESKEDIEKQWADAEAEGWDPGPGPTLSIIIKGLKTRL